MPSYAAHHNLSKRKIALDNIKNDKKMKEKVIPVIYQLQVAQYQLKASHGKEMLSMYSHV